MRGIYAQHDAYGLSMFDYGFRQTTTKGIVVKRAEDLKGVKIRVPPSAGLLAAFDAIGAGVVGIVAGILVVVVVEGLDLKLHIDDPVGAVAVHMLNGIWGTIAVGLFATQTAPGCKDLIDGPFAVINADDYYGVEAFSLLYNYLTSHEDDEKYRYCMVGFHIENTIVGDEGFESSVMVSGYPINAESAARCTHAT